MLSGADTVQAAKKAFKQGRYEVAIQLLEEFCSLHADRPGAPDYVQAQVGLVKAYQQAGSLDRAKQLTERLAANPDPDVQDWAKKKLIHLAHLESEPSISTPERPPIPAPEISAAHPAAHSKDQALTPAQIVEDDSENDAVAADLNRSAPVAMPVDPPKGSTTGSGTPPAQLSGGTVLDLPVNGGSASASTAAKAPSDLGSQAKSYASRVRLPLNDGAGPLLWVLLGTVIFALLVLFWWVKPETNLIRFRFWPPTLFFRSINAWIGWVLPILGTMLNLSAIAYFVCTPLLDLMQRRLYQTRWISVSDLERRSPEAGRMLRQTCLQADLKLPWLGVIQDPHPVAFSYGASPNGSRIVVSQGALDSLNREEIAAVYAHELGRICHRDSAVLTLLTLPLQLLYWLYVVIAQLGEGKTTKRRNKDLSGHFAPLLYLIYQAGSYPFFFLCRVGTSHADHFAAEVTGDPNSLSRALLKISHGVLNASRQLSRPSFLMDQIRVLGIFDPKTATAASTAYRVAHDPQQVRRIFLWDLFSPWARWMQINSSHPLLGKRIRALGQYAERLRQTPEFGMDQIPADRQRLDQKQLMDRFQLKMAEYAGEVVGLVIFWILGLVIYVIWPQVGRHFIFGLAICGFGVGMAVKTVFLFPRGEEVTSTVLEVLSDPYATPLSERKLLLKGQIFGRGKVGYQLGAELKLQDETGTIPIRYTSRLGPLGNLFLSARALRPVMGTEVEVTGWLRRGLSPYLDVSQIRRGDGVSVRSHPRFWQILFGCLTVGAGIGVMWKYVVISRQLGRFRRALSWRSIRRRLRLR